LPNRREPRFLYLRAEAGVAAPTSGSPQGRDAPWGVSEAGTVPHRSSFAEDIVQVLPKQVRVVLEASGNRGAGSLRSTAGGAL